MMCTEEGHISDGIMSLMMVKRSYSLLGLDQEF